MILELTDLEVANIINGYFTELVESSMDSTIEEKSAYSIVKKWKFNDGRIDKLCVRGITIIEGYRRFDTEKLPELFYNVKGLKEKFLRYLILR